MSGSDEAIRATLLLVDDTPQNLIALKAILDVPEYSILTATSGEEALKLALRHPITVVLLDVLMPGMDGYEVARHFKELERTRDVPILFLTAVATDVRHIYRAYEVGAVDYIIKPLDAEVVRRKVGVFVDIVLQRRQIERQAQMLREADKREHELQLAELRVAGDRRYRKLVEGIDHAIGWSADERLRLTFVSRQAPRILGYPMERFLEPEFWANTLHPGDRSAMLELFQRSMREGIEIVADHRIIAAGGRIAWFHTGVSGERGTRDTPAELHGISVDVTELKHAEEEAQRLTRIREELLAVVAHDLRNPLGAIRLSAGALEQNAARSEDERTRKAARLILRSADRMDRLIRDLLDYASIYTGHLTIERTAIDAASLIRETVESFKPIASEKGVRLEGEASEGLELEGDRGRLLQVLSNLVGNAIQFTPEDGSVVVRAERAEAGVRFAVSDSGRGMSKEDIARIWDRYWQSKRAISDGGLGLGLSIAKGLVEAHGGAISVESTPNVGTSFTFDIPQEPGASIPGKRYAAGGRR